MLLIFWETFKKFNFNINIFNVRKFIKIFFNEIELQRQSDLKHLKEIQDEIDEKIKENNEKRLESSREDLNR